MCGICGVAGVSATSERFGRALDALAHRGPDSGGEWAEEGIALGHRRLAVLDLSADGAQPMSDPDGVVRVVFNGEIYNFRELREELRGRGAHFQSRTDTEVLVQGYRTWGIDGLLDRISGMFAFAIWDSAEKTLHLARDHMGKKPLFYHAEGGTLYFASTLPSLIELLPRRLDVDLSSVASFLWYMSVPGEKSILSGVHKLLPGHRAEFRSGTLSLHRYWGVSYDRQDTTRSVESWIELVEEEVERAVIRRLASDVPIGMFLSGGVDSSLVAAMMAEHSSGSITTISARFLEEGFDESVYARRVAEHIGSDHREYTIRPDAMDFLPRLVYMAGEPFGDQAVVPLYLLSERARRDVTVVLTGDGGDECFAGYVSPLVGRIAEWYRRMAPGPIRERVLPSLFARLGRASGRLGWAGRQLSRVALPARYPEGLRWEFDALGERAFRDRLGDLFTDETTSRIDLTAQDEHWHEAYSRASGASSADRILETEMVTKLPDMFLVKADVATMAHGLEARSPLLDRRVVEMSARIPASVKTRNLTSKFILKEIASRHVPRNVVYRRKRGFAVPTDIWFRGHLAGLAEELLLSETFGSRGLFRTGYVSRLIEDHQTGRAQHGQRIWLLCQLELWMRMFVDGSLSPSESHVPRPIRPATPVASS